MTMPVLEVEGLSISFTQYDKGVRQRSLPVIRDLDLTIRPGQVVAVVGSSGSGKSLLAHGRDLASGISGCGFGERLSGTRNTDPPFVKYTDKAVSYTHLRAHLRRHGN